MFLKILILVLAVVVAIRVWTWALRSIDDAPKKKKRTIEHRPVSRSSTDEEPPYESPLGLVDDLLNDPYDEC